MPAPKPQWTDNRGFLTPDILCADLIPADAPKPPPAAQPTAVKKKPEVAPAKPEPPADAPQESEVLD